MTAPTQHKEWKAVAVVHKWEPEKVQAAQEHLGLDREPTGDELWDLFQSPDANHLNPEEHKEEGNLLTTAGLTRIISLLAAAGGQGADATHTLLGVGDTNTTATVADTALGATAGSTHQYWMVMDSTFPSVSGAVLTAKATWASADGNFTGGWQEWAIQITTSAASSGAAAGAGIMLNHKIANLGTKVSGAIWSLTVTLTLS